MNLMKLCVIMRVIKMNHFHEVNIYFILIDCENKVEYTKVYVVFLLVTLKFKTSKNTTSHFLFIPSMDLFCRKYSFKIIILN